MSTWELLADLPVEIEDYALEPLSAQVSSDFERKSTVIRLRGAGEDGAGEDVTYEAVDQDILQAAGPSLPLAGRFTLASFAEHLAGLPAVRRAAPARGLTAVPHLGVSVRRPGPRAAPGSHDAPRGPSARARAGALRRVTAPGRAAVA